MNTHDYDFIPHNSYVPIKVITTKGIKEISHLRPGDQLYRYQDGKPITITDTFTKPTGEIYRLHYNDGRSVICQEGDVVHLGFCRNMPIQKIDECDNLKQLHMRKFQLPEPLRCESPVELDFKRFPINKLPDPYVAGALFTYGAYDDPYMRLPEWTWRVNGVLANKYQMEYAQDLSVSGWYYFSYCNSGYQKITWHDFFPGHTFFAKDKCFMSDMVPEEYRYGSILSRWQYLHGAFDAGYDHKVFPDEVGIVHWSKERLEVVQWIMWSLGITSEIVYLPNVDKERPYQLTVTGKYAGYPGFFMNPDQIARMINYETRQLGAEATKCLEIVGFERLGQGFTANIKTDGQPATVYYTDNFLPRVSL